MKRTTTYGLGPLLSILLAGSLLVGCKTAPPTPLEVEGFPGWQQTHAAVSRVVPELDVPRSARQGVDDTASADLTYRWAPEQTWEVTQRESLETRSGSARREGGRESSTGKTQRQLTTVERYRYTVLTVDDDGSARIEQRLLSVHAELSQDGAEAQVLDSESGETSGEATLDARQGWVDVPLTFLVEPTGQIRKVLDADAGRARALEGLVGDALDRVQARLTDPDLIGDAQTRFMLLPGEKTFPRRRWSLKVPGTRPGKTLTKHVLVESIYLGTFPVDGQTCAKIYSRRVIPGERDELGETKAAISPGVIEGSYCLRLEDQRVVLRDATLLRLNALEGTSSGPAEDPLEKATATIWKLETAFEYGAPE